MSNPITGGRYETNAKGEVVACAEQQTDEHRSVHAENAKNAELGESAKPGLKAKAAHKPSA
jgi:hypothetical protein